MWSSSSQPSCACPAGPPVPAQLPLLGRGVAPPCRCPSPLWKILKEMGIPDHLTCLLRNLCEGQGATVRTGHETTSLTYSFSYLEPVCCSMSSSNCCFLTFVQISQEAGQVVWYSYLFQNFPVCCDPHSQRLWSSQ